jgi:hypothetical protein
VAARVVPRLRGVAIAGAILLVLATLGASAAVGAPSSRHHAPAEPFELPAGLGCNFPTSGHPDAGAGRMITEFSDGRTLMIGRGNPTLTNLETGYTVNPNFRYSLLQIDGSAPGTVDQEWRGSFFLLFYPGDTGPDGLVDAPGALLAMTGRAVLTWDLTTDLYTAFSFDGKATDLCDALAG